LTGASITNLRFPDLRHEATSRFFEKGLNVMEVAAITGHKDLRMLQRYTHLRAGDLALFLGSENAFADLCPKADLLIPLGMEKDDRTVSIRSSETNLRSGPGVRFCPMHMLDEQYQNKTVQIVGKFDTWRLITVDDFKGWVHKAMLSNKLHE
tara:strand:- start:153 stop:608 length:456 start_codon:yes stop_codon:yes gene_type:complete